MSEGGRDGESIVEVRINGRDREVAAGMSVRELLALLELTPELVVVERNRRILDRERYGEVKIEEGDELELVHFVGGG